MEKEELLLENMLFIEAMAFFAFFVLMFSERGGPLGVFFFILCTKTVFSFAGLLLGYLVVRNHNLREQHKDLKQQHINLLQKKVKHLEASVQEADRLLTAQRQLLEEQRTYIRKMSK